MKVFCDLDGTLVDPASRHHRVYAEVTKAFGGTPLDKQRYWSLKRRKTKWSQLLPLSGVPVAAERAYLDQFIDKIESPEYLDEDALFSGALEALKLLSESEGLYLVSLRRRPDRLAAQLERLKIAGYFTEVLSGHSESDGHDVKVRLVGARLNDARGAIIGDTEADIVTGKTLGLTTVAVSSGLRDEAFLKELAPDHLLEGIGQIGRLKFR